MILKTIHRTRFLKLILSPLHNRWISRKADRFIKLLSKDAKIMDLGSGNCLVAEHLIQQGFNITPVDVSNLSIVERLQPICYDGTTLTFKKEEFDYVLLLTVLHHTEDPAKTIRESKRVAKQIIIIEDTYRNKLQKVAMQFMDLLVNFGQSKMNYQNKSERGWEELFNELNLKVLSKKRNRVLWVFRQTLYYLERM